MLCIRHTWRLLLLNYRLRLHVHGCFILLIFFSYFNLFHFLFFSFNILSYLNLFHFLFFSLIVGANQLFCWYVIHFRIGCYAVVWYRYVSINSFCSITFILVGSIVAAFYFCFLPPPLELVRWWWLFLCFQHSWIPIIVMSLLC